MTKGVSGSSMTPWTHKKHPKHEFLGLKCASKYSMGFDTLNKDFSFLKTLNK